MKFDPESALHLLLEQALKNVTLDGYASFLATFFVQFMPVASLVVREFDTNHITQLAHYAVNKTVFSPPRVVTIPDALVYELYLDPDCSGDKYKASILSSKDGTSRTRVFTMLHMAEETSIFFPLLVDDRFLHCFYISISAIGKNKYTEEHLQICESLRIPLANALTVLLQRRSESPLSAFPPLAAGQTFNGAEAGGSDDFIHPSCPRIHAGQGQRPARRRQDTGDSSQYPCLQAPQARRKPQSLFQGRGLSPTEPPPHGSTALAAV